MITSASNLLRANGAWNISVTTMERTRILHIITGLYTGGAENMLRKLVTGMDPRFHNVVISLRDPGPMVPLLQQADVEVHCLDMPPGRPTVEGLKRLLHQARQFDPHLLQGWMYHGNLAASMLRRRLPGPVPAAWNIRQTLALADEKPGSRVVVWLNKLLSAGAAAMVYNSAVSAQQHENYGFSGERRVIIPNGVDISLFQPDAEEKQALRNELNIPAGAPLVGLVARYHPIKDHPTFIRAAARIRQALPDCHFLLAGADTDSSEVLADLSRHHALQPCLHRLGERRDIPRIMNSLDVLMVTSSAVEGFPNVVIEGMACGLKCVVTDIGDSRHVVAELGTVTQPGDDRALAAGVVAHLALDAEQRAQHAGQCRQRVVDRYTIRAVVDEYQLLYDGLLKRASAAGKAV